MRQYLILKYRFPDLNEYIKIERSNRYAAANMKKEYTELVAWECKAQKLKFMESAYITFEWMEENRRRNIDNIAYAKKFIIDGLVLAGILKNDGWGEVKGFKDDFRVGENYEVFVKLEEAYERKGI
jgi:Holliday junction resolvase RusA-like endonuclease